MYVAISLAIEAPQKYQEDPSIGKQFQQILKKQNTNFKIFKKKKKKKYEIKTI